MALNQGLHGSGGAPFLGSCLPHVVSRKESLFGLEEGKRKGKPTKVHAVQPLIRRFCSVSGRWRWMWTPGGVLDGAGVRAFTARLLAGGEVADVVERRGRLVAFCLVVHKLSASSPRTPFIERHVFHSGHDSGHGSGVRPIHCAAFGFLPEGFLPPSTARRRYPHTRAPNRAASWWGASNLASDPGAVWECLLLVGCLPFPLESPGVGGV